MAMKWGENTHEHIWMVEGKCVFIAPSTGLIDGLSFGEMKLFELEAKKEILGKVIPYV